MRVGVTLVEECGGKLLERMDVVLVLRHCSQKALLEGGTLVVEGCGGGLDHQLFQFVGEDLDFCSGVVVGVQGDFFL